MPVVEEEAAGVVVVVVVATSTEVADTPEAVADTSEAAAMGAFDIQAATFERHKLNAVQPVRAAFVIAAVAAGRQVANVRCL
jgi:hypothetical protein